ncbi:Ada metal-binding domain-containing protein [Fluviicola sp.]|uniref:Ada metal-binding domain-containing protein n=1 Tax=Fluviicola sp. TaxID=1917219 RepID=UPI0031D91C82
MLFHTEIANFALYRAIRDKSIVLGGNRKGKIYGELDCISGKRMKRENRVFFASEAEAIGAGYRPCGHCMKESYQKWKNEII